MVVISLVEEHVLAITDVVTRVDGNSLRRDSMLQAQLLPEFESNWKETSAVVHQSRILGHEKQKLRIQFRGERFSDPESLSFISSLTISWRFLALRELDLSLTLIATLAGLDGHDLP